MSFSRSIPTWDERLFLPLLTGDEPFSPVWLFRPHGGHVMPLPYAVSLALHAVSGGDFRVTALANVVLLAAIAAGLLLLAKRLRGCLVYADAVLPLATLQPGQAQTILWGFQIQFVCSIALMAGFLAAALLRPVPARPGDAALRGALLLALPLCGGNGVAAVIPLALWALWLCARTPREAASPLPRALLAAAAVAALAVGAAMLAWVPRIVPPTSLGPTLASMLQAIGLAFGSPARFGWSLSEGLLAWPPPVISLAAAALAAATLAMLAVAAMRRPDERLRATANLAAIASVLVVAFAIGEQRAGWDALAGTSPRYVTLMLPLLWCVHFAWELHGSPVARRLVQHAVLAALCATCAIGALDARAFGQYWRALAP
jgi:hypothetical protein